MTIVRRGGSNMSEEGRLSIWERVLGYHLLAVVPVVKEEKYLNDGRFTCIFLIFLLTCFALCMFFSCRKQLKINCY